MAKKAKKYTTLSDLATYHTIVMNGKKLGGVQRVKVEIGFGDDLRTLVTLQFVIKAGSLKADGEAIAFDLV